MLLLDLAAQYNLTVYEFTNVGNHLHLLVKAKTKRELQTFLRVFPQKVIFLVTGTKKGQPVGKFFHTHVFSRLVDWGRDFQNLKFYFTKNFLESEGVDAETLRAFRAGRKLHCRPELEREEDFYNT